MSKLLDQSVRDELEALASRYPKRAALLLPALHAAQKQSGWLSPEVLDEIAEWIGLHPAVVRQVASFYTMYYLKPVGTHVLRLCTNVSCSLRGADRLIAFCEKRLGIRRGETSLDGKVTLMEEECLGACGTAPALMLGDRYVESLDEAVLEKLFVELGL